MLDSQVFQDELDSALTDAQAKGALYVDVNSGNLHRKVGVYPERNHRMPVCCSVMRKNVKEGDEILHEPPKGKGASLTIRYYLPR